ncbi:MAG: C4-type zinc ribbon domain-containing protein [Desulfobacterales bacterium]
MTTDIGDQTRTLSQLQKLELEVRRLQAMLGRVEEQTGALNTQLQKCEEPVASAQSLQQELQKTYRAQETELQANQDRIAKSQEKLRLVKTNKEYQSGLKEIDDLKQIGSKLEDEMIAGLDRIQAGQAFLNEHQAQAARRAAEIRAELEQVQQETAASAVRLAEVQSQADEISRRLAPELLALYRRIRDRKPDGIAVSAVRAAVCGGCHVNIPPQMYNEMQRRDRLKNCPNCDRIIFWENDEERSE